MAGRLMRGFARCHQLFAGRRAEFSGFPDALVGDRPEDNVVIFAFIRNHTVAYNVTKWFPYVNYVLSKAYIESAPFSGEGTQASTQLIGLSIRNELFDLIVSALPNGHRARQQVAPFAG